MRISIAVAAILALGAWPAPAQNPDSMLQALELYRHRNCKQAEPLLEHILDQQPRNVAARKLYAGCLMQMGQVQQAKAQYKTVLATSPGDREALDALHPPSIHMDSAPGMPPARLASRPPQYGPEFQTAEVLIRDKRLGEAEPLLQQLLSRTPSAALPRQRLAEIYSATSRFDKAAEQYRLLAAQLPEQPAFHLREAQNLAWAKQYEPATAAYRDYLKMAPGDLSARLAMANVLMWSGSLPEAGDEFRAYLEKKPGDRDARVALANVLLWMKRYADAAEEFKGVLASNPSEERAEVGLAQSYVRMGQPDLAVQAYDRALKLQPDDAAVADAKTKLQAEIPRQQAYAEMDRQDNAAAARHLLDYLQQHPESDDTVLQIARLYSWSQKYREAMTFYTQYLERKPEDRTVLRELAKTELSAPDFESARRHYTLLVGSADAAPADYEGLINAYVWDGKLGAAQDTAAKLAAIDPQNKVALQAVRDYADHQKNSLLDEARELTAAKRYPEAADRYSQYREAYGSNAEVELALARLYSWDQKLPLAETAYRNYLAQHPSDVDARLELANVERWGGHYDLAAQSYHEVLSAEPRNSAALLGLAQVADSRGADPFQLVAAYRSVLAADPNEAAAQKRVEDLAPSVTPSIGDSYRSFGDSDGFYRGEERVEFSFPLAGKLRIDPYYSLSYFHQYREVGGGSCADNTSSLAPQAAALSSAICARNGSYWGNGAGVQTRLGSETGTNLLLDAGVTRFSVGATQWNGRADLTVKLTASTLLFLDAERRPAVWDVNTGAALAAGLVGETALVGAQTDIRDRWRLWWMGGITRYTAGTDGLYGSNVQRRFSSKLDYGVLPSLRAGYIFRVSTFEKDSPYYFSPARYLTYGLTYSWSQALSSRIRLQADGEGGLGQIKRFGIAQINTFELAALPAIVWTVYPGLDFHVGYRFSRGRSSAFGSPVYETGGLDFGIQKSLGQRYAPLDPARLDIH